MIKELLLYFALLLWFVVPSQAQLTIFAEDITGQQGDIIDVSINVEDFTDVVAMQFTFEWDSLVLDFVDVVDINLVDLTPGNFGPSIKRGYVVSTWFETYLTPTSVPDGTLFKFRFRVIGDPTEKSELVFSGSELPNFASINGMQVEMESREATFMVQQVLNTTISVPNGFDLSISPNPFQDIAKIDFTLDKNYEDFTVSIYSLDGKLLHQQIEDRAAGSHTIQIDTERLPNSGIYFVQMLSEGLFTSHKLILENY